MTRTDAIIAAVTHMLETHRAVLDGPALIRAVRLDVKITPEHHVRAVLFAPEIESAPVVGLERYAFTDTRA